jgi:arylsulfatase A-like enzyme
MHFKNNGYHTISNGKIFHHKEDLAESWDENWRPSSLAPGDYVLAKNIGLTNAEGVRGHAYENADVPDTAYQDGKIAMKAIHDLRKLKEMDKPFFLACGFMKPHLPFNAPKKYWDIYKEEDIQLPDNRYAPEDAPSSALHNFGELRNYSGIPKKGQVSDSLARTLIHGYYACVSYVDQMIGMVLDELKALDLEKNTIVILWGDHGWNLMEHGLWCKHCNFRTSLRSTLMLRAPGRTSGQTSDALVEFVDIYPTLCELSGLELPTHLEGKSFVPLLDDPDRNWKDFVVCKFKDGLTIKTQDFAYTEWSTSDSAIYARMLYDHNLDLEENINISERDKNLELVEQMSRMMKDNRGKDFNAPVGTEEMKE